MAGWNVWKFRKIRGATVQRTCGTCDKQHTMRCPNSSECYSIFERPHWEPKKYHPECEAQQGREG